MLSAMREPSTDGHVGVSPTWAFLRRTRCFRPIARARSRAPCLDARGRNDIVCPNSSGPIWRTAFDSVPIVLGRGAQRRGAASRDAQGSPSHASGAQGAASAARDREVAWVVAVAAGGCARARGGRDDRCVASALVSSVALLRAGQSSAPHRGGGRREESLARYAVAQCAHRSQGERADRNPRHALARTVRRARVDVAARGSERDRLRADEREEARLPLRGRNRRALLGALLRWARRWSAVVRAITGSCAAHLARGRRVETPRTDSSGRASALGDLTRQPRRQGHLPPLGLPWPRRFIGCFVKGLIISTMGPGSNISPIRFVPASHARSHDRRSCPLSRKPSTPANVTTGPSSVRQSRQDQIAHPQSQIGSSAGGHDGSAARLFRASASVSS